MNMYYLDVLRSLLFLSAAFTTTNAFQKAHDGDVEVNHIQNNI